MGEKENDARRKRLEKELNDIRIGTDISADATSSDLTHWQGIMKGPEGTPYHGGSFTIDIDIPSDYPYNPPKMKFMTRIWHPNISSVTGAICLDVLGTQWSPALTIRTALLSIQALLSAPEPHDPQDGEVAKMFKTDRNLFEQTAKYWTETFAPQQTSTHDDKIGQITGICGNTPEQAREALEKHNWDVTEALNSLLG